jgi:signal transduction histidine kinase
MWQQEIETMKTIVTGAIKTTRRLSVELNPPILEGEGLAQTLGWFSRHMQEQYGLEVNIEAESPLLIPQLDRRVLIFQLIRELLFNVVKHAQVSQVTVRLQEVADPDKGRIYRIEVVDGGIGFVPDEGLQGKDSSSSGRGLQHVIEQLRFIGGHLEIDSAPEQGTRVTIVAPSKESIESGSHQPRTKE